MPVKKAGVGVSPGASPYKALPHQSPASHSTSSTSNINLNSVDKKPNLSLFGYSLSHLNNSTSYIVLTTALFVTTCGYSYYQELVIYSWFQRKLGVFTTMLYFIGSALCIIVEKLIVTGLAPMDRRSPWSFHILLSFLKLGAQMLTNMAMQHINYPAKVLFKSAIPIAQMFIGIIFLQKKYKYRDYLVVVLLCLGLVIFLTGNSKQPDANIYGIALVTLSTLGAASIPMVQEHCMNIYGSLPNEILYFSFIGASTLSLIAAIVTGEFIPGMAFLASHDTKLLPNNSNYHSHQHEYHVIKAPWLSLIMLCTLGYLGAHCSTAITQHFGSLVNGITSTARKATTIGLSYFLFPEEHPLTIQHAFGSIIFFSGLIMRLFHKSSDSSGNYHLDKKDENLDNTTTTIITNNNNNNNNNNRLEDTNMPTNNTQIYV